jgi:hypothetical protein
MSAAGPSPQEVLGPEDLLELWPILVAQAVLRGRPL